MAFRFVSASSHYLEHAAGVVGANDPLTILGWGKTNNVTAAQILASVSANNAAANANAYKMEWAGNVASDPIRARKNASANASSDTGAFVANRWTPAVCMWLTNTSRYAWKDHTLAAQNTTSVVHGNALARTNVGTYYSITTRQDFFDGNIAEVGWIAGAITPNEMHAFSSGIPLDEIFPNNRLLAYLPLRQGTGIADLSQYRRVFSNSGATPVADHPPILYTPKRRFYLVRGADARALSGAISEAADAAAGDAEIIVAASAAIAEAADAALIEGEVLIEGSAAIAESADAASIAGEVLIDSSAAIEEGADSFSGLLFGAGFNAAIVETADTASGEASVIVSGSAAIAEAADAVLIEGQVRVTGSLAQTEAADTASGEAGVIAGLQGAANESGDAASGEAEVLIGAQGAIAESIDAIAALGHVEISIEGAVVELSDEANIRARTMILTAHPRYNARVSYPRRGISASRGRHAQVRYPSRNIFVRRSAA